MPGHNAFQRNAFQRNAFQIVYDFAPTTSGGLVLGGSTTTRFRSRHHPVVTGGIVLGGSVTCSFHQNGHHLAIVTGGLVLGGEVTCRFVAAQVTPVNNNGRPAQRQWFNLLRRKHHYKPKVTGGLILGSDNCLSSFYRGDGDPEQILARYSPQASGGLILGGSTTAEFYSNPPSPLMELGEKEIQKDPEPEAVHFRARISGRDPILVAGIKARFTSNPPPPPRITVFSRKRRLARQIEEEDELLLMGLL